MRAILNILMARIWRFGVLLALCFTATAPLFAQCFVVVDFDYTANCNGQPTHFSDSSSVNTGNTILTWTWNFGDGFTANTQNPNHIYAAPGTYTVTLNVTTSQGCNGSSSLPVTVHAPPVAFFSISNTPVSCNQEFFDITNSSTGNSLSYNWTFGNGSTSQQHTPQHAVPPMPNSCSGFNYITQLIVEDINGCTATTSQNVFVQPRPTAEILSASDHICAIFINGHYEAEHTLFNMSYAPCLQSYVIDWGDGTPPESESTDSISYSHLYNNYGFFPVAVYGISSGGACSTVVFRDTVLIEITPTAGIIGPSASWINGCVPFTTYFIVNSTVTPTTTQTVIWGGMDTVTLPNTVTKGDTVWHTFTVSGCDSLGVLDPFNIVLTAENQCGTSFTSWGNYSVHRPPIASFNVPDTICKNDFVTFVNTTNRNLCAGWTLTPFNWKVYKNGVLIVNFNNIVPDANSVLPDFSYAFQDTGTYTITLTATDNGSYGCGSSQYSYTIYVQGTYAGFIADTVCLGNPTTFTDSSYSVNGTITSWQWNFGDGTQSNDTNTVHTFTTSGFHNVTLVVFDSNNCSDTISEPVYVSPYPEALFGFDTVCLGSATHFNDLSFTTAIDSIVYWEWWLGDGDTVYTQNPVHTYSGAGFYDVTLIVSTSFSCPDTITQSIYVSPFPQAAFTSDSVCLGNPTSFTDLSVTGAIDSLVYWWWDFGDGTTANDTNPSHVFGTPGFHDVTLVVESTLGCSDTVILQAYVSPPPIPDFVFDTVCLGYPNHFIDSSISNSVVNIVQWYWDFGDSITSYVQSPNHSYADTGYFEVTLTVTTLLGCTDSIKQTIYVNPYPVVNFTSTQVCLGGTTQFTGTTTTSPIDTTVSWLWDFGGGNTSTLQNPSFTFSGSGNHQVTLQTVSVLNCEETVTHNAYVSPFPVADFNAPPACMGTPNNFINQSTTTGIHPINQWYWTFGDGSTATTQSPNHTYGDTGVYNISLVVATTLNCVSDTVFGATYVSPYPTALFTADTVCLTHTTHFTDLSTTLANDSIISWQWDFGDGNGAAFQNPTHTYADSGIYTVTLIISSSIGCEDTITRDIYVKPLPVPDFSAPNTCYGNITAFTDLTVHNPNDVINSWQWNFGDGSNSGIQNPTHIYSDSGVYTITLVAGTNTGCFDSISHLVYISPAPVAAFSIDSVCLGEPSTITESSYTQAQDSIISWQWFFGNGVQSSNQLPVYTYPDTGHYNVSLVVSTGINCTDTAILTTYISPLPQADFTADTACLGNATHFSDLSYTFAIDDIISWQWDFGDGSASAIQNPSHNYGDTGQYTVTLIVTSLYACSDTIQKYIYVKPLPLPGFTAPSVCFGFITQFNDTSFGSLVDTIYSWQWHFGDGNMSSLQHPAHVYGDSGLYNVTLIVASSIGCSDSISRNVYVSPAPHAAFNYDTVCQGNATTYTDISYTTVNDTISGWQWDFGDGITAVQQNPQHLYSDTGHFNVSLVVTTSIGCTDTLTQSNYVSPYPVAAFAADTACLGFNTVFTDLSATAAIDSIISWQWGFGDGSTAQVQHPLHTYADSGQYTVTLIISSAIGCSDTISHNIYVNAPPVVQFGADTVCEGQQTTFSDNSAASVFDQITGWFWQFGDGSTAVQQHPVHLYADSGVYQVTLTVYTLLGCSDSLTHAVYVSPYPHAAFNTDTVCIGGITSYTDLSYTDANDIISQWQWDFGDSNTATLQNPQHTYADTGFYNVTLIVSTTIGCSDTVSHNAYNSPYPEAAFLYDTACLTFPTHFTDLSVTPAIDSIIYWQWDFGDGHSTTQQNPLHTYADSGFYTVTLTVSSTFGCSDTTTHTVYVKPLPVPGFSTMPVCFGTPTVFNDTSFSSVVDTISTWTWYFGDGTSSNLQNPTHLYNDTGVFSVTLVVSSSVGCSDSAVTDVYVSPLPEAGFVFDTICIGNNTNFSDESFTLANDSITDWAWQFGDNTADTLPNPAHIYADTGFFDVTLLITTSIGCTDSIVHDVFVSPSPIADFEADSVCLGMPTTYTDISYSLAFDTLTAWDWDFGDGTTAQQQNPTHIYADTGHYSVTLICYTQIGCSGSITRDVYVKPLPYPEYDALPVCFGQPMQFNDMSSAAQNDSIAGWLWHIQGMTNPVQNPVHVFGDTGIFNVTLVVTGMLGCSDSVTHNVYVSPYPEADFMYDTVCMGHTTGFSDISQVLNSDSLTQWIWHFGDGSSATQQNPQHIYTDSGFYNVNLTVSTSIGCADSTGHQVYVSPSPIAYFSATTVCLGNTTIFTDSSYTPAIDTIQSWLWDFGDGQTSALQHPQHTYADTGVYQVNLAIESTIGCPHTVTKDVYVSPYPLAMFTADTICTGNPTSFSDNSYTPAADSLVTWYWQFGDGTTATNQNTAHTYADSGHYNVQLVVNSSIGCSDSLTNTVYVSPYPVALFTADTACLGAPTTFTGLSYTAAIDSIISWQWDFGDGNTSLLQNPVHSYGTSGNFTVVLIAGSSLGCNDTLVADIYVSPLPQALFAGDTVCTGVHTTFTDLSSTTATDSITSWVWDFGDGQSSSVQHPTHLYGDTGIYPVTLIVNTSLGCTDTIINDVYNSPMPVAVFTADTACLGQNTTFTDLSYTPAQDTIISWHWDFGNGNASATKHPNHIYADTGHYNVTLIVQSGIGCTDTVENTIYVSPYPHALFTADTACLGATTSFTGFSYTDALDSIISWVWDFGDGTTDSLANPTHTYITSGVFNAALIVTSSIGCSDTLQQDIYVSPPPVIVFSVDSACRGYVSTFTDLTSIVLPDSAVSWQWYFGDGDSSAAQNPTHIYPDTGHYAVSFSMVTAIGCVSNATGDAYVKPHPVADFLVNPTCSGFTTVFTDQSLAAPNDLLVSWYWDFGDGSNSALQSPLHTYSDTGTYSVMLVAEGLLGCSDTIFHDVHIIPLPVPDFEALAVCYGDSTVFVDLTDGLSYPATGWLWDFGDGTTDTVQNPVHLYTQPGIYNVQMIVTNTFNCSDSISRNVTVHHLPEPGFSFNNVCLNENTVFTDTSSFVINAITAWLWQFGDSSSATLQNPSHLYGNYGNFNVTLSVTDSAGCSDSLTQAVTVYPLPVAAFVSDSICSGETAIFADSSTTVTGTIDTWSWNFGDGSGTSAVQHPTYLYAPVFSITDYNVSLIVSNSYGCLDTVIQIFRINPLPVPQFTTDTACFGNQTQFTDQSNSNGGALASWAWEFGDLIGTDTVQNPQYIYGQTGFFTAQLHVTDVKGCTDSVSHVVLVDSLPIPSFDWCQVCMNGQLLPVTFDNTSQGNGSTIIQNYWTFGNGQNSNLNDTVTNNYTTAGTYNVTLISTNDRGCSDSVTQAINVHSGLAVNFTSQVNCFDVTFHATSDNATNLIEWEWDFGDGSYSNSHDSATHTFYQPGTYTITLTVYDSLPCMNLICQASVTNYIYVYPPPVADFSAPNVLVGQATDFIDLSTAPLSSIVSWQWDFGDGNSSTFQNPSHTYAQYGFYDVTLTIQNGYGCTETITQQVIVYPALIAEFDSATVCSQTPLTINNTSQVLLPGVPVTWFWDFGDGQFGTDSLPTHTYGAAGTYNVILIVSMSPAVADTAVHQITVIASPVADFLFTEVCLGDTLTVLNDNSQSTHPITQWRWDLGDGTLSNQPIIYHNYLQYGTYQVLLIVQNSYNCIDSVIKTVHVWDVPEVSFFADPKSGCQPLEVNFSDSSSVNSDFIINWLWDFGDGLGSIGYPAVNHTYNSSGVFDVTILVTTDKGCQNTKTYNDLIHVYPKPTANFSHTPAVAFSTDMVYFENNSTGSISWLWDFGNGDNSFLFNPYYIFDEGFNDVYLVAYNQYNCTDTAFQTLHIKPTTLIYAPNAFSPLNNDGLNDFFMVSATNIQNLEMRIFNRYGDMIFYTDDINKGWDGRYEGEIVPMGIYVWKVWYKDAYGYNQEKYGSVMVIY